MILTINYNKTSGAITLFSDIDDITTELNENATEDNSSTLSFEVAIDTSVYEKVNEIFTE